MLRRNIWLFFSVTLLVLIPIELGVDRILYWGWKQREFLEIAEQAENNYLLHLSGNEETKASYKLKLTKDRHLALDDNDDSDEDDDDKIA